MTWKEKDELETEQGGASSIPLHNIRKEKSVAGKKKAAGPGVSERKRLLVTIMSLNDISNSQDGLQRKPSST